MTSPSPEPGATFANLDIAPAVIVALCALVFTISSFWWLNARQGKLRCFSPHSFSAVVTNERVRLLFPFVFYNTGAKPIVIQNMRLDFPRDPTVGRFEWLVTRSQVDPNYAEKPQLPAVFYVDGRSAIQVFAEFGGPFAEDDLGREFTVRLECKLGHRRNWVSVMDFEWRAANVKHPKQFIPYSNAVLPATSDHTVREENK